MMSEATGATVDRFMRGGFQGTTGGQLMTIAEWQAVRDHITSLQTACAGLQGLDLEGDDSE